MEIRPVDLADDDLMAQLHAVTVRALRLGREDAPVWSLTDFLGIMRSPDSGERSYLLAACLPGSPERVVGFGVVYLFLLDNLDKAWLEVHVDPAHARQGVGTALVRELERRAVDDGRTLMLTDTKLPAEEQETHGYRRFLQRLGYSWSNVEVVRHAPLPVPEADLDAWAARAAVKAGAYEIRTLVNEVPPEIAASLGELMGQLAVDAPTGAVDFEAETVTPQRLDERLAATRAMGRDLYETVALAPDGSVAAQSTLAVPGDGTTTAWQWGTFVHRAHRGRSLGLAVKTANLRAAQSDHPELRRVTTQNAETNEWMIAINDLMGFRPVEVSAEFLRHA